MLQTDKTDLESGSKTIRGEGASRDAFAIATFQSEQDDNPLVTLGIVAQGMWGRRTQEANEQTAKLAIEAFVHTLERHETVRPNRLLGESVTLASEKIAQQYDEYTFATCATVLIVNRCLYTVSVGNCRIYLLRDRQLQRLSRDHTWIQRVMDAGLITEAELEKAMPMDGFPFSRVLGWPNQPVQGDFRLFLNNSDSDEEAVANQGLQLHPGDQILLCSPGLHGSLRTLGDIKDEQIREVWLDQTTPQEAVDALISLTRQIRSKYYEPRVRLTSDDVVTQIPGTDPWDVTVIVLKIPQIL